MWDLELPQLMTPEDGLPPAASSPARDTVVPVGRAVRAATRPSKTNWSLNSFSLSPPYSSALTVAMGPGCFCKEDSTPSGLLDMLRCSSTSCWVDSSHITNVFACRTSSSTHKTHCSSGCMSSLVSSHSSKRIPN